MSLAETTTRDPVAELREVHALQRAAFTRDPHPSAATRKQWLRSLLGAVLDRREALCDAMSDDFDHRCRHEATAADIYLSVTAIKHLLKHVEGWMKPRGRALDLIVRPARGRVVYQPLGVVGVISPWNYPALLALQPLATALAAGNRVMLKPSEHTPRTSQLLEEMLSELFPTDLVAVHQGGPDVAAAFSEIPFDHLLFTGSTQVGRLVMQAAAKNLTPVTLELGGKSPAIVHRGYDLGRAAERIGFGKLFNAGQTCVAPDYALVHTSERDAFVESLQGVWKRFYPTLVDNPDYTAVVNERHRQRLRGWLADAEEKGARLVVFDPAGESFEDSPKLPPTVVLDPTDEMVLMQEEIFGPILPVITYDSLDEALAFVQERPRPLALYYFDDDKRRVDDVLRRTHAGGVTVNDTLLHLSQEDLPFGGVGPSGMGAYHGFEGFETFSHKKSVFHQARINGGTLLHPPYGRTIERLMDWLIGR